MKRRSQEILGWSSLFALPLPLLPTTSHHPPPAPSPPHHPPPPPGAVFKLVALFVVAVNRACTNLVVAMSGEHVGSGAAMRRRLRRLRSWHRHERQSIALALATACHHPSGLRHNDAGEEFGGLAANGLSRGPVYCYQSCWVSAGAACCSSAAGRYLGFLLSLSRLPRCFPRIPCISLLNASHCIFYTWLPTLVLRLLDKMAWQKVCPSSSTSGGSHHLFSNVGGADKRCAKHLLHVLAR